MGRIEGGFGRIGRLLKTKIDKYIEQVVETRFGYNQTVETFAASGDDSPPLPEDRIIIVQIDGTGNFVACGVLTESQGAKPGEKYLFSRDKDGDVKAVISLLNDGTIKLKATGELNAEIEKAYSIKTKDALSIEASGAAKIKGQTMELNSTNTKLTGGNVQCDGKAAPNGQGCFCGLPFCLLTGAPHIGNIASGA